MTVPVTSFGAWWLFYMQNAIHKWQAPSLVVMGTDSKNMIYDGKDFMAGHVQVDSSQDQNL